MIKKPAQRIRYLRTPDGVQLAWAEAGTGPMLIKAANWMTHLEYEWESPVWRHWIRFFSEHFRYIRHDERGCGMTDWNVGDLSFARWIEDLEAVVAAVNPQEPFALLGISQGAATCIAYAVKHPERVSRLVLYGAYARGTYRRGDPDKDRFYRALIDLLVGRARNESRSENLPERGIVLAPAETSQVDEGTINTIFVRIATTIRSTRVRTVKHEP